MGVRVPIHSIRSTLLLCLCLSSSHGLFTQNTCWNGECVQRKETGTWCYVPKAGETALLDCKGNQSDLQSVMNVHLAQNLSIAYYNGVDNSRFGGAFWPVPANAGVVRLCVSGYAGDGTLQTLCVNVDADNSISGSPYCEILDGPHVVSDGCYTYQTTLTPVIQTIINSPPPSSANPPPTTSPPSFSTSRSSSSSSTTSSQTPSSSSPSPTETSSNAKSSSNPPNYLIAVGVPLIVAVITALAVIVGRRKCRRRSRNRAAAVAAGGAQHQQVQLQPMQQPGHQQPMQQPEFQQPMQHQYPPPQEPRPVYGFVR